MSAKPEVVEEAYIILSQLGGRRFLVMTGANKLMAAGRTASNPNPWLRMDLRHNQAQVNRLKITLMPTDTYKVEFYHQELVDWEPIITNQQTCLLYTSPSPRDRSVSRMPSSA